MTFLRQTRQLGRHLKAYARAYKSLALKITQGNASTMTTTIESSFLNYSSTKSSSKSSASGSTSAASSAAPNAFQSTVTATISTINLDRSIYEEAKPSKHETTASTITSTNPSLANTNTPSLTNLLSQPIGTDLLGGGNDLLGGPMPVSMESEPSHLHHNHHNQATDAEKASETEKYNQQYQQFVQQQQTLNQWASGATSNTQIAQLTAQMTTPPALFIYVIDPFDYYLYNTRLRKRRTAARNLDETKVNKLKIKNLNDLKLVLIDLEFKGKQKR